MSEERTTYSHHHFLWPFRWDWLPAGFDATQKKEDFPFDERTSLTSFEGHLMSKQKGNASQRTETESSIGQNWQSSKFEIKTSSDYNEFTYFHSFVRKSIYDTVEALDFGYETMRYYEYKVSGEDIYIIGFLKKSEDENGEVTFTPTSIRLLVKGITLHVFNTGVGILSFDLENQNEDWKEPDSILIINEVGRRIYPQFLDAGDTINGPQHAFLATSLTLDLKGISKYEEKFTDYNLAENKISVTKTFLQPKFFAPLFNESEFLFHVGNEKIGESKILLSRVMSDRMFFLCWYGNTALSSSTDAKCYREWNWWYAYIFGDKDGKSVANAAMQREHLQKHTYERWSDYGNLYGMSHDSFVCLSPDSATMRKKNLPAFDVQMNTMYYQIAVLCLAQRASILKFSAEVSNLSDLKPAEEPKALAESTKNIYWNYIQFKNKIYFREITPQIQGVEIYNRFQEIMNIPAEVEILEDKIKAIHNYLNIQEGETMNREMHRLSQIATLFLPAGFIAALFGIGAFTGDTALTGRMDLKIWSAWGIIIAVGLFISLLILFMRKIKRGFKRNQK